MGPGHSGGTGVSPGRGPQGGVAAIVLFGRAGRPQGGSLGLPAKMKGRAVSPRPRTR